MKVLVVGSDGRAHALVWKLFNSPDVSDMICAPGNGGISQLVPCFDLQPGQERDLASRAFAEHIDLIVPASSAPLHAGLADEALSLHLSICGPPRQAAGIARSRCQAKEFLLRHNLPTARGQMFQKLATAEKYLAAQPLPIALKADDPRIQSDIYYDRYAALDALRELFAIPTEDGSTPGVVIEEFLPGIRVSFSAFTDGETSLPLLPTRLYDRIQEEDEETFAPGMGAQTSTSTYARKLRDYLHQRLIVPIVAAQVRENLAYGGVVGIDCIITAQGPRITGLRCSLSDMEAQVILPRLEDDLLPILTATVAHRLGQVGPLRWRDEASVGIALVAQGYPHHFPVGSEIRGLEHIDQGVLVFHDGTHNPLGLKYDPAASNSPDALTKLIMGMGDTATTVTTTGGHVLTVVALGATLQEAHDQAVHNAERISFAGRYYRDDIGLRDFA